MSPTKKMMLALVLTAAATAAVAALLVNIFQRKQEENQVFFRVVELTDETEDPAVWGKNFPFQYDAYTRTVDQVRTRFGGSEALPRTPTEADPRSVVAQSKLEEDPRLKTMWAGYAFAHDFREERGHAYMLDDQTYTERQIVAKQPGTCLQCHSSVYTAMKKLGDGDLFTGFDKMNSPTPKPARSCPIRSPASIATRPIRCSSASPARRSSKACGR
jgi:nitrite reductase (cytochrome c-552)